MYKLVVFDLDGTLANTLEDLADAANYGLKKAGLPTHKTEKYAGFVGSGADNLVKRAMYPVEDEAVFKAVKDGFNQYYSRHSMDRTVAYQGTEQLLNALAERGVKTAVLSNKPDIFVDKILEKLFPEHKFTCAWGKKSQYNIKPDPAALNAIIEEIGVDKADCIYVGDSDVDCYTAQNAGVECCGVSWGFRGRKELIDAGAHRVIDSPEELLTRFKI